MSRHSVLFLFVAMQLVFGGSLHAGSLEIIVNGQPYRRFSEADLSTYSYQMEEGCASSFINVIQEGSPHQYRGVSLDELLPLFIDAWGLTVTDSDGTVLLKRTDNLLAEQLYRLYVSPDGGDITLSIIGELLEEHTASVWVSWEGVVHLKEEIARFAALHDLDISVLEVPNISTKLVHTHRAGAPVPDLVMVQSDYMYELSGHDIIQPLDYYNMENYNPRGVEAFTLNDRRWAVPFYFDTQLIIARSDILDNAGCELAEVELLVDFEQLLEQVQMHTENVPISWNVYSAYWLLPFQFGFGKERLVEPDGQVIVDDGPTREALTYLLSLIDRRLLDPFERDAMFSKFVDGSCALMLSSSYLIPELERLNIPFELAAFPGREGTQSSGGKGLSPLLDFKGFSIPKKSRNPIIAKRLLQYLGSVGVQQRFTSATAKIPAVETATMNNPYRDVLELSSRRGRVITPDVGYSVYKNIMWKMLRLIITRQVSPDEGLSLAQDLIAAQLADTVVDSAMDYQKQGVEHEQEQENTGTSDDSGRWNIAAWLRKLWSR